MAYIGKAPGVGIRNRFIFTATAGQTVFSGVDDYNLTLSYTDAQFTDVFLNGVKLDKTDYTATSGTSIVLAEAATLNDTLEVLAFDTFSVFSGEFSQDVTIGGTVTADGGAFTGDVTFGDGNKALFGAGSDLQIYHTGSDSVIQDAGQGDLYIKASNNLWFQGNTSNDVMARFQDNGAVTLYHDNSAKLATTSTGIDVTGTVTADNYLYLGSPSGSAFEARSEDNYVTLSAQARNLNYVGNRHIFLGSDFSERMRIDSSGNVGIGTILPADKLHVEGNIYLGASSRTIYSGGSANLIFQNNTGNMIFSRSNGSSESMRIDSSGNVGIGTSSPLASFDVASETGNVGFNYGTLSSPDRGNLWYDTDGTGWKFNIGKVQSGSFTSQITIQDNGNVGIGTSSPTKKLQISGSSGVNFFVDTDTTNTELSFSDGAFDTRKGIISFNKTNSNLTTNHEIGSIVSRAGSASNEIAEITFNVENNFENSGSIRFLTASSSATPTERMRIDSSGVVMVSRTSAYNDGSIGTPIFQCGGVAGTRAGIACIQNSTAAVAAIGFANPNGTVGSISTSGTSTTYATSSDYRLKENVVPMAGAADRLAQIPVHRFNFIADPDTTVDGFLAHEVQAFVPEAVTGEKDAVDKDGKPVYQGIDQSKLVPLLTAALQEARTKIETLEAQNADFETRIAALEAN
jgi:hypothetical protein